MHKLVRLALAVAFATLGANAAFAKRAHDGDNGRNRSITSYSRNGGDGGTSRGCLTRDAGALLSAIEEQFGRVEIISTCRPGARIATSGRRSKHASGEAIDFRVPGRKKQVVSWLIGHHHSGGTMTYSDMDHIHVDVGHHFVALNRPSGN